MSVEIHITGGPLPPASLSEPRQDVEGGAVVCFQGVVRSIEEGRYLAALEYDVYEPMTSRELRKLAERTVRDHELLTIVVEHSRGIVPVGEISFRLRVTSRHRKEALLAMDSFIDQMKQDVPIWKKPVWKGGESPDDRFT